MQVILQERVRNLGHLGDKVNVKAGFARNFLVPYGKAVIANKDNLAAFEVRRAELETKAKDVLAAAEKRAEDFKDVVITIARKASDEGTLYGAVGVHEVLDEIRAKNIDVEKRELTLAEGAIHAIGTYSAEVQLHSDVVAKISIVVEAG